MQGNLLAQLTQTTTFSQKLITILQSLRKSITTRWQKNSIKQIQHHLISLTCQNKNLLHYKYLEDKNNNQRCIAYIIEILTITAKNSRESRENIASLFLAHVLSHTSCYVCFYCFYVIVQAVPDMLEQIDFDTLLEINGKIKKQQHSENFKALESIRISENNAFTQQNIQLCQRNLQSFLLSQSKPYCPTKKQKSDKVMQTKIPPLLIPTSKSINSSRYSAVSREEKRKGLVQFQKLASNLGEGFITVELGCLLANKRTRQVQEFSQNQMFREKCMEKLDRIETQRMNSSRLTMHKGMLNQNQDGEQNAKKYYRKVLTVNLNLCLKKLPQKFNILEWINKRIELNKKKTETYIMQCQSQNYIICLQQIIDMSLVGMLNLSLNQKQRNPKKQQMYQFDKPTDIFNMLTRNLKTIAEVTKQIMTKVSLESQKLHLNLLLNRNKGDNYSSSHFAYDDEIVSIRDQFLGNTEIIVNEHIRIDGGWKDQKKVALFKKYSDPVLLYLGSWLQSLQQLADMSHPMFYFYQTNVLKDIAFYLHSTNSKVSHYFCAEYIFRFLLMIKRQIMQLSHPYLSANDPTKSGNVKQPLSHKYPSLIQNFFLILTALLEASNRHIQKMFSNIFIKNIYFMQTLQNYFEQITKEQNIGATVSLLKFYKKCLQIYTQSSRKHAQTNRSNQSNPLYFLFQHIAEYLCPRNGCISKLLIKYESFISPNNLDEFDQEENNQEFNKFNTQISTHLIGSNRKSEYNIQNYLHQIFMFVAHVYYLACPTSQDSMPILQEDVSSFFIKYSIMNFIKLYSLLTVSQIANISGTHEDYMLSTKESPHYTPKINTKQIFMIDFLKILTNISINRTPEIAKKFRQHRVLEFFVREIQLEFSVRENIQKYIKRAVEIKSVREVFNKADEKAADEKKGQKAGDNKKGTKKQAEKVEKVEKGEKKMNVPGLNLTGEIFKKDSQQQKSKQTNNPNQNISQKPKKLVPSLNIPTKTQQSNQQKQKNKKGYLDDIIDEIVVSKNPKKKSFKQQLNLNLKLQNLTSKQKSFLRSKSSKQSTDSNMIYFTERKIRKIYSNKILHAESIMLILSLILYKGQLDPIYCDQMPIIHGKLNVLYILHYHLNHEKNKSIISILSQSVAKIKPALSGQRLFKLLSNHFTDLCHYYDWTKINAGAFGVIMSAKTHLNQPREVAIKQMNFPKSIYERCVLNDIFTEITSLEMFRLEDRVTRMYNYGVSDNTYVIIMKKYACSLRDWRLGNTQYQQAKLYPPTLPNILALFYEIIRGLKLLHEQNVTHYDIKGDNILLQFLPSLDARQPPKVNIVFADFGVAKIYDDEKDELDLKSRGTQCIKSPQMLTLALKNKKQADNYDRRKKIGTTKASDIWSLGCLLYQMVTGQFLFNSNDWVHFFMQVTSANQQILSPKNCQKMKNNVYLIDFIKYILIRDPQHRPSIQNIICRFESLYALLVTNPQRTASQNLRQINNKSMQQLVKELQSYIKNEQKNQSEGNLPSNKRLKSQGQFGRTRKVMEMFNTKNSKLIKIMEDIYFCQREYFVVECEHLIKKEGVTHIIAEQPTKINRNKFKVFGIKCKNPLNLSQVYRASPRVSDILREVLLMKGKLLFVNSQSNFCVNLLIYTLSYWFKCSAYETWCLINTQILQFPAFTSSIISVSQAANLLSKIEQETYDLPKLQCICGSVTIILKKKFQQKRGDLKVCKCKKNKGQNSGCFSKHCPTYLQLIHKRYNIVWDHLTWTLCSKSQILTPLFDPSTQQVIQTQLILNSANPLSNMITDSKTNDQWKLYQCKVCEMWIMATNYKEIWLILNNLIKSCRQGIMIPNAQQDFKTRTPALNFYTLSKLHMTQ